MKRIISGSLTVRETNPKITASYRLAPVNFPAYRDCVAITIGTTGRRVSVIASQDQLKQLISDLQEFVDQ